MVLRNQNIVQSRAQDTHHALHIDNTYFLKCSTKLYHISNSLVQFNYDTYHCTNHLMWKTLIYSQLYLLISSLLTNICNRNKQYQGLDCYQMDRTDQYYKCTNRYLLFEHMKFITKRLIKLVNILRSFFLKYE